MRRYTFTYYPSTHEWKDGNLSPDDLMIPHESYEVYAGTRYEALRRAKADHEARLKREYKQRKKERINDLHR